MWYWVKNAAALVGIVVVIVLLVIVCHPDSSERVVLPIVFGGLVGMAVLSFLAGLFVTPEYLVLLRADLNVDYAAWHPRAVRLHPWLTLAVDVALLAPIAWRIYAEVGVDAFLPRWAATALVAGVVFVAVGLVVFNFLALLLGVFRK